MGGGKPWGCIHQRGNHRRSVLHRQALPTRLYTGRQRRREAVATAAEAATAEADKGSAAAGSGRWTSDQRSGHDSSWVARDSGDAWKASGDLVNSGADLGGMTPSQAQQYVYDQLYK